MGFVEDLAYREKFAGLSFMQETVWGRTFEECEFIGCSFVDARFDHCKFLNCTFSGCLLSALVPMDSQFQDVKFSHCKAIGVDWTKTTKIEGLDFSGCQINYSNFKLLKVPEIKMVRCEVKEVQFHEADLSGGDFKGSDFESSIFFKTDLTGADFRGARNYSIDVKSNTIKKARFSLPEVLGLLNNLEITIE